MNVRPSTRLVLLVALFGVATGCTSVAFEGQAADTERGFSRTAETTVPAPTTSAASGRLIERLSGTAKLRLECDDADDANCERQPAAGVIIDVFTTDGELYLALTTNEQGAFVTTLPIGDYLVAVRRELEVFIVPEALEVSLENGPAVADIEISVDPAAIG